MLSFYFCSDDKSLLKLHEILVTQAEGFSLEGCQPFEGWQPGEKRNFNYLLLYCYC